MTKQLLTSISVDKLRIYLPLKDIHLSLAASENITFSGRWILLSSSLKCPASLLLYRIDLPVQPIEIYLYTNIKLCIFI